MLDMLATAIKDRNYEAANEHNAIIWHYLEVEAVELRKRCRQTQTESHRLVSISVALKLASRLQRRISKTDSARMTQPKQMRDILRSNFNWSATFIRTRWKQSSRPNRSHFGTKRLSLSKASRTDVAKKIVKLIKDNKVKVQASIQGDKVRVTGKKRDDLQSCYGFSSCRTWSTFQFDNFRDSISEF